jgi:hypothetical protein
VGVDSLATGILTPNLKIGLLKLYFHFQQFPIVFDISEYYNPFEERLFPNTIISRH